MDPHMCVNKPTPSWTTTNPTADQIEQMATCQLSWGSLHQRSLQTLTPLQGEGTRLIVHINTHNHDLERQRVRFSFSFYQTVLWWWYANSSANEIVCCKFDSIIDIKWEFLFNVLMWQMFLSDNIFSMHTASVNRSYFIKDLLFYQVLLWLICTY